MWAEKKIGDILLFQRGFDITKKDQKNGDIPIVSSSGIKSYHNKMKVKGPGVVIGRKGTLGGVYFVKKDYWPHDTTLWIKNFKKNSKQFIYYFLKIMRLESFDTGSSNPTLNRNHIHKIKVIWPERKIQDKIAAILSAYDDIIENNNRRIAILEKMAEEIYKEWFVRMRFPGHARANLKKTKVGLVPNEWTISLFATEIEKRNGFAFKSEDYTREGYRIVRTRDFATTKYIDLDENVFLSNEKAKSYKKYNLEYLDYLIVMVGASLGRYGIVFKKDQPALQNQNMWIFRPKSSSKISKYYIYFFLPELTKYVLNFATGAARDFFRQEHFLNQVIAVPNKELLSKFDQTVNPIFSIINNILSSNNNLKQTRDRLLTRLISGKLSVADLDIRFPRSMKEESDAELHP